LEKRRPGETISRKYSRKSETKMKLFLSILLLPLLLDLQPVAGQGKAVSSAKDGETCPFLDGVFVSVMRRIFSQGFHKQLLSEVELMLTTTLLPDK
jgi:hypothetical protein